MVSSELDTEVGWISVVFDVTLLSLSVLVDVVPLTKIDRLGNSVLNLNKRAYRMCLCGNNETEEHLLLNCSLSLCASS